MEFPRSFRRLAFTLVTLVTGFVLCFSPLQPALAFTKENPVPIIGPGMPVSITGNVPEAANSTYKNIYSELTRAGVVALTSALQLFLGQAAYDFAEYIATGGKGQAKLFFDGKIGEYLTNVGSDAAGEFMASLSDSNFFKGVGFNICQPRDPTTLLRLQTSLGDLGNQLFPAPPNLNLPNAGGLGLTQYSRPKPRCDFQAVIDNYDTLYHTMSDGDIISNLEQSFDPGLSQLGALTNTYNQFLTDTQRQVTAAASQRAEGNGFRPVEGLISGNIRTPAQVVQEATNEQAVRKPGADQSMLTSSILTNAWEAGPIQLAIYTGSIFLNTLASKFMQRIFEKGLGGGFTPSAGADLGGPDSVAIYGKTDARNANIDLRNPPPQQVADYDVVSQMQTCLASQRGAWNCVMDQSLVQAVRSKTAEGGTTVREALERGFLHPDWRLIPETRTRENQDDQCYAQAYCAGNLQKMRLMRILPVGFELAANSQSNQRRCDTADGCVTLQEVAKSFTSCNDQGQLDDAHPWCHLIDPNWVITSFPQQCTLTGYTDTLVSSKLPIRKEECQDIQTCLSRNDKGECVGGFGYCMAERSVYRFQADACPASAASCRIYTDAANKPVGYLRNTIDRAACDASNAGCLWYATQRATSTSEEDDWAANSSTGNRMYFKAAAANQAAANKGLESCPAGDEGCTRLYAFTPGKAALNLIINGSFESTDPTTSTDALGWKSDPSAGVPPLIFSASPNLPIAAESATAYLGAHAMALNSTPGRTIMQSMSVVGGRSYVLSYYARSAGGSASLVTRFYPTKSATSIAARYGISTTDLGRYYHGAFGIDEDVPGRGLYRQTLSTELSQDWQRFEYAIVVPSSTQGLHLFLSGDQAIVDGVQLEEGEFATTFIDTLTSGLPAVFMKVAPEELQCMKPATDPTRSALCSNFAQSCNQMDAGCQGYHDQEGGQEVPAILSDNDLCPAACVGYAEYRKSASSFDLVKDVDPRFSDPEEPTSTAFIPQTAGQCTQQDVGCEAFTIVDSTGRTDGGTTAYSYLRACEQPGADSETYFTWEGADTAGYQLRTWSLKKDVGPFDLGPRILTKIQPDQISFKEPDTCNENSWRTAADPDCRQFYDARGRLYYRYFSQTVLSTSECLDLRVTRSDRADCELTGGRFNERSECTYGAFLPESRSCNIRATGCRMFTGANSGNTQSVLSQSFREGITPFESAGVVTSSEALLVGDMSLRVGDPENLGIARTRATFPSQETSLYRATFWAKVPATSTTLVVRTARMDGTGEAVVGSVRLTPDWQRFTVGMFEGAPDAAVTRLIFTAPLLRGAGYGFYLDEVSVIRVQDLVYARNNTWTTPAQCDQGLDGGDEPQAMLNCKTYANRQGKLVNARRFTRLCRETAIGCTAFIDTRNTDETYGRQIVQPNPIDPTRYVPSIISLPADRYIYLVDDPTKRCNAQNMSCRAFGKPKLAPNRQVLDSEKPFETVYFKDDVTRYNTALCKPSEAYCAEFKYGTVKEYFRDPGTSLCEYRESKILSGGEGPAVTQLAGWYVKGSAETPCYPSILEGGNAYGIARSGDATYKGYVGTCAETAGECTELRDVSDANDPAHRTGKSYFYIKNDSLDTSSCNGTVDLGRGCVLFRDMSSGALNFNARATYEKYKTEAYKPVTPVDCRNNPENPACTQPGRCTGTQTSYRHSVAGEALTENVETAEWTGTSECRTDADCRIADVVAPTTVSYRPPTCFGGLGCDPITTTTQMVRTVATCNIVAPERSNDANLLLKVSVDRECSQWLGCRSSETVLDPSTNRYTEVCSVPALCDKASNQAGDKFCASYVDRRSTTTEPMLTEGAVLDAKHYASRHLGLGQKDYSGYSIPNAFQVMDLQSVRVAVDGAKTVPDAQFRLSQDYRLTAAVAMPPVRKVDTTVGGVSVVRFAHTARPTVNQAKVLGELGVSDVSDGLLIANPNLALCKHMGSGRIGYFLPNEVTTAVAGKVVNCYLPIHSNSDLLDFNNLAEKFASTESMQNNFLSQAYPAAECRAQPEQDAPFPASFTTEWDTAKNPAKPVRRLAGFVTANTCEFGEDCSCTYKRVDYDNAPVSKFYNQFSNASPPGICIGGPRDGQACIPSKIFNSGGKTGTTPTTPPADGGSGTASGSVANAVESANTEQLCGPPEMGGQCQPAKTVTIVRGTFGNCLERDLARTIGKNQGLTPCLTWNPTLLLNGDKDPYHYNPTAGYMPPQNSGQYYCLSDARKPKTIALDSSAFVKDASGKYSGAISDMRFDDHLVSNGSNVGSNGNDPGAMIDGLRPNGSNVSDQCENTDQDQDDADGDMANAKDFAALRIVNTGRGTNWQYTESFFKIAPNAFAKGYYDRAETADEAVKLAISDNTIGYLGFTAIRTPNSTARLACGYNQDWVDGISTPDYNEIDQVRPADVQWQNKFNADFNGVLTRSSEKIVTMGTTDPTILASACLDTLPSFRGKSCFFKTWETDYRTTPGDDKMKFVGLHASASTGDIVADSGPRITFETLRTAPFHGKCSSIKPYFSIRAVFQSAVATADPTHPTPTTEAQLLASSPVWTLAGYWVTACGGSGVTDEHYIYMYPRVQYGDVCRELAEVVSRDSHQDAAFTDRAWKDGNFTIPVLGIAYNARYSPFSSALNTRAPGRDPLFQTGQEVAGYSPLNPPTFLAAGYRTYYTQGTPNDKWAFLTNVFARVYRIYNFYESSVGNLQTACLGDGPNKGKACTPTPTTAAPRGSKSCSLNGVCNVNRISLSNASELSAKRCNGLSGLNTGLVCPPSNLEICHTAPIQVTSDAGMRLRQLPCLTTRTWTRAGSLWKNGTAAAVDEATAAAQGAFRCAPTPASLLRESAEPYYREFRGLNWADPIQGAKCTHPTDQNGSIIEGSEECPERILNNVEIAPVAPFARRAGDVSPLTNMTAAGTRRMQATCVSTDGTPLSVAHPGHCSVNIPRYTIQTASGTFEMPEFIINPNATNYQYGECTQDTECSFTQSNVWSATYNIGSNIAIGSASIIPTSGDCTDYSAVPCSSWQAFAAAAGRTPPTVAQCRGMVSAGGTRGRGAMWACSVRGEGTGIHSPANQQVPWPYSAGVVRYPGAQPVDIVFPPNNPGDLLSGTGNIQSAYVIGECVTPGRSSGRVNTAGVCDGGLKDGQDCSTTRPDDCKGARSPEEEAAANICDVVSTGPTDGPWVPVPQCAIPDPDRLLRSVGRESPGVTLNNDNNMCTHEQGYSPRPDLCPNPSDEYCGLIAYNVRQPALSVNPVPVAPARPAHLPTDVTLGLHKLSYLLNEAGAGSTPDAYSAPYIPRPPMLAAPDIQNCPTPGKCAVQGVDKISLNGLSEGAVSVPSSQAKTTMRFYAWAADNQMPLRSLTINWGDGQQQKIADGKIKNHKPYCGARSQCATVRTAGVGEAISEKLETNGLTCNTDNDCPVGAGSCKPIGTCRDKTNIPCATDGQCRAAGGTDKDVCQIRTMFGNSPEACEENYFEFTHLYTCNGPTSLPLCRTSAYGREVAARPMASDQVGAAGTNTFRCERDPDRVCNQLDVRGSNGCAPGDRCIASLAPTGGCWDDQIQVCRFTPKVMVQDNWGWCTGECRTAVDSGGGPIDNRTGSTPIALHPYGGCYAATPAGSSQTIRDNIPGTIRTEFSNECKTDLPKDSYSSWRPWVVYSGSVNLRSGR